MSFESRNFGIVVGDSNIYVYTNGTLCFVCDTIDEAEEYIHEQEGLPQ